jgi:hypothetical protein
LSTSPPQGDITTRNQQVAQVITGQDKTIVLTQKVITVRMLGDIAVANGTYTLHHKVNAAEVDEKGIFTHVFERVHGGWLCINSQRTVLRQELSDLLLFERGLEAGASIDDLKETSNYVTAMEYGLGRLKEGFPSHCDCSAKFMRFYSRGGAGRTGLRANFAAAKTGLVERGLAMLYLFRRHLKS